MIREQQIAAFLACVAAELAGPIRKEVQTDYARKIIDALNLVLSRLIAEAGPDQALAASRLPTWSQLEKDLPRAVLGSAAPSTSDQPQRPLDRLDGVAARLQQALGTASGHEKLAQALKDGDATSQKWLRDGAHALNDILQGLQDNLSPPKARQGAATVADDPEQLRLRLGRYLSERFPSLPVDCVTRLTIATGGQIKRTALFRLVENKVLPTRLVLRQDMPFNFTGTVVTDEFETLKRVSELGVMAPKPMFVEAGPTKLGGGGLQFMVMCEVEDAKGAGEYFPEERAILGHNMGPTFGHEVAGALARLHSSTRIDDASMQEKAKQQREAALQDWRQTWAGFAKAPFSLAADLGAVWMLAHPLPLERPRSFTHGDMGAHNLMSRDGHLAALLDWELAREGDPSEDLAQAKMMLLPDIMPWQDFVKSYVDQGGPAEACDPHAVAYYCIWTYLKHGAINTRLWNYFKDGSRDDAPAASIAGHFIERLSLYQARALVDAVGVFP